MVLAEWGIAPEYIEEHWTNSQWFRMCDALIHRKTGRSRVNSDRERKKLYKAMQESARQKGGSWAIKQYPNLKSQKQNGV